jgi:hypothetical protein
MFGWWRGYKDGNDFWISAYWDPTKSLLKLTGDAIGPGWHASQRWYDWVTYKSYTYLDWKLEDPEVNCTNGYVYEGQFNAAGSCVAPPP